MDQLALEQRLVLFTLSVSAAGDHAGHIARITGLTETAVESSITQLQAVGLIRQITGDHPRFYTADSFDSVPIVPSWDRWLTTYCDAFPLFVERDAEATTYCSCGVILLAALLADTRNAELIAHATTFPRAYVQATLDVADELLFWRFDSVLELRHRLLRAEPLSRIDAGMDSLKENFWMAIPYDTEVLEYLRNGRQFGGRTDDWPETEDVRNAC